MDLRVPRGVLPAAAAGAPGSRHALRYHPGRMSFRRSRLPAVTALVLLLALAAAPALSAQPRKPAGSVPRPKVIFVGWDGGDWVLLDRMMREGRLPNLAAVVANGRTWDLESFQPMASPMVWNTIVTGRTPVDHGVADFQELDPKTRTRLPISGRSRKVPAIWNLASAKGMKVGVVGFWATWPAEKVNGFFVSDRAAPVLFDPEVLVKSQALTWPEGLADGVRTVVKREWNPPYEEVGKALRVSRPEFDAAVAAGRDLADPITGFRKILATTRIHAKIALDLYERERPDLTMVYFQGTDEIGHVAGRFAPPKLPQVSDADYRKFSDAVDAIYVESDRILGQFRAKAGRDGATLVIASDHGFRWREPPGALSGRPVRHGVPLAREPGDDGGGGAGDRPVEDAREGDRVRRRADPLPPARTPGRPEVRGQARGRPRRAVPPEGGSAGIVGEDGEGGTPRRPGHRRGREEVGRGVHEEADRPRLPDRLGGRGRRRSPRRPGRDGDGRALTRTSRRSSASDTGTRRASSSTARPSR